MGGKSESVQKDMEILSRSYSSRLQPVEPMLKRKSRKKKKKINLHIANSQRPSNKHSGPESDAKRRPA